MKKNLLLLTVLISGFLVAQKKPKIQGNKVVTEITNVLEDFDSIEIADDLEINITQGLNNKYNIITDENLIEVIKFDISAGVLKIYTTHNIRRKKELTINVNIDTIQNITLLNDAKLISQNLLSSDSMNIIAKDNSKYNLDIASNTINIKAQKSTKGHIKFKGENTKITLNENATLKGNFVVSNINLVAKDRSDINISGSTETIKIVNSNSSDAKLELLRATNAQVLLSDQAEAYIYANTEIKLYSSGKSKTYIYANPKIILEGLKDESQIIKKK